MLTLSWWGWFEEILFGKCFGPKKLNVTVDLECIEEGDRYWAGNDTENDKFFHRTRTDMDNVSGVPYSLQWLLYSCFPLSYLTQCVRIAKSLQSYFSQIYIKENDGL